MKLRACLLAFVAMVTFASSSAKAQTSANIDWGANFGNNFLLSTSAPDPLGNALLMGHFQTGTDFTNQSFSYLFSQFVQYDTAVIGQNDAGAALPAGNFFATTGLTALPGTPGDSLYMWAFNRANPTLATEWAIVTNALWTRPGNGGTISIDIADIVFVPPGAAGQVVLPGDPLAQPFDVRTQPVPEPSTYVLALVGLGVAGGIARRRRQAVG